MLTCSLPSQKRRIFSRERPNLFFLSSLSETEACSTLLNQQRWNPCVFSALLIQHLLPPLFSTSSPRVPPCVRHPSRLVPPQADAASLRRLVGRGRPRRWTWRLSPGRRPVFTSSLSLRAVTAPWPSSEVCGGVSPAETRVFSVQV